MEPPSQGRGGAHRARMLAGLLKASYRERPWGRISAAFQEMPADEVGAILEGHPDAVAGHLHAGILHAQLPTAQAVVAALERVDLRRIGDFRVIAALCVACDASPAAFKLVRAVGAQRALKACVSLCGKPERLAPRLGSQGFLALCGLELDGRNAALARSLRELCGALPENFLSEAWGVYDAAGRAVRTLIEAGHEIPELEQRLSEIAACPPRLNCDIEWLDDVLKTLIDLIDLLRERSAGGRHTDLRGRRQSFPGARSMIVCLARCLWRRVVQDIFEMRGEVLAALKKFPADEVTDVIVRDFLPDPAEQARREDTLRPAGWGDGEVRRYGGALQVAAEMLAADAGAWGSAAVFDYCRMVFAVKTEFCERPTWPLSILAAMGPAGAAVIREFQMQPGRERLGSWDFEAERATAEALSRCSAAEAEQRLKQLLDELLSGDRHLFFEAECSLCDMSAPRLAEFSRLALDRLEGAERLAPEKEARLLWALSGRGAQAGFVISPLTFDRAVDAALERRGSEAACVRAAALGVLAGVLQALFCRDWRGFGPQADHPRGPEIADAAVLGFGDPDPEIRKSLHQALCESTHDLRAVLALPLLKAAVQAPNNRGVREVLNEFCAFPTSRGKMLGLNTGHTVFLREALVGEDADLRRMAAALCGVVLCDPEDARDALLGWLKEQTEMPRNRRRRVLPVVLEFARRCPEPAGRHDWIVAHAAECVSWEPTEKLRCLHALCGRDSARLAALVRKHGLDLSRAVESGVSAAELEALMAAM